MIKLRFALLATVFVAALNGCYFIDRHSIDVSDYGNRIVEADGGDRFYFDLDENITTGYEWEYSCDDRDVEVTLEHVREIVDDGFLCGAGGKASVRVRALPGFRGPATINFSYRRKWEKTAIREFSIVLYSRGVNTSFWN